MGQRGARAVSSAADRGRERDGAQRGDRRAAHVRALAERAHARHHRLERRAAPRVVEQVDLVEQQQPDAADHALRVAAEAREGVPPG